MRIRKVINKPVDIDEDGVHVTGGINTVMAANVNETGPAGTSVSSRQRIVQRSRRRRPSGTDDQQEGES